MAAVTSTPAAVAPPLAPQTGRVPAPPPDARLPQRTVPRGTVTAWWMGAHGGAGETTLEQLLEGSRAARHAWPVARTSAELPPVVLVARTSAHGLQAAKLAATEWAAGAVLVELLGLVLIADAPGRLPRPLKDLAQVVAGGVPRVWRIPWVEAWRLGEPVDLETAPKAIKQLLDELRELTVTTP